MHVPSIPPSAFQSVSLSFAVWHICCHKGASETFLSRIIALACQGITSASRLLQRSGFERALGRAKNGSPSGRRCTFRVSFRDGLVWFLIILQDIAGGAWLSFRGLSGGVRGVALRDSFASYIPLFLWQPTYVQETWQWRIHKASTCVGRPLGWR